MKRLSLQLSLSILAGLFCFFSNSSFIVSQVVPSRLYDFEDTTPDNKIAKDARNSEKPLVYKTDHPFEIVEGVKKGSKAVRLDRGYFETEAIPLTKNALTVAMTVRVLGPGSEPGNAGSKNGTLFGMGDGYWSGMRYTVDTDNWSSGFSLGRPQPSSAVTAWSSRPFPVGRWVHLVATWNGTEMVVYLDEIPYAYERYSGPLTEPNWNFRVGFNDAGVGSVNMDVDEISVSDVALAPAGVLERRLGSEAVNAEYTDNYVKVVQAIQQQDWITAKKNLGDWKLDSVAPDLAAFAQLLRAEVESCSGNPGEAITICARLAVDEKLSQENRENALYRCIPTDTATPLVAGSPDLYRQLSKLPDLTDPQKHAIRKCWAEAMLLSDPDATRLKAFQSRNGFEEYQTLVDSLIQKKYVRDYLAEERAELAAEQKRIAEGKSPWGPIVAKTPLEQKFKPTVHIEVAPGGSLTEARNKIRALREDRKNKGESELPAGGVEVVVRGGVYPMQEPLELDAADTGTEDAPIVYRAADGETPLFLGSVALKDFQKVSDPKILERLPEESRAKVLQLKLADCGIDATKLPPMKPRGYGANGPGAAPWVDLYVDDRPLKFARHPNHRGVVPADRTDFLRTGEVLSEHKTGVENRKPGQFEYADPRIDRWRHADDVWLFGYWKHLWAATSVHVRQIDPEKKEITVDTGANPYGYVKGAPFYAFNLLEEIDVPGEWFLDRKSGVLYVYPPDGVTLDDPATKVRLSVFDQPFLQLKDVSHTTFLGLTFEDGCATGAVVEGGERVWFAGCRFHRFGAWGISIHGKKHGVLSCDVRQLGGGGVSMSGGDVPKLMPGECFLENNHIADLTRVDRVYGPAVSLDGVGNRIAHNLMHHSPAHGMRMGGFEHVVEFNEIHSMVYESDDQSGIDMFGNPTLRGNVIRYNYWHHIGSGRDVAGQSGIRLDDMISDVLMYGNVFYKSADGQFGGIQIHGGKDNIADNNLFLDCKSAFSFSPWPKERWLEMLEKGTFADLVRAGGVDITKEPFKSRYPDYAEIRDNVNRNYLLRNAAIGCGAFARNDHGQNVILDNVNIAADAVPGGIPAFHEFGEKPPIPYDWPVYTINGMRPLPIPKMGLYPDDLRVDLSIE